MWPHDFWKEAGLTSSWLKARIEQRHGCVCKLDRNVGQEMKFEKISLVFLQLVSMRFLPLLKKKKSMLTIVSFSLQ